MDKMKYDQLIQGVVDSVTSDLLKHGDAVWEIVSRENYQESLDAELIETILMDRLVKIYATFRQMDGIMDETNHILNSYQNIQ